MIMVLMTGGGQTGCITTRRGVGSGQMLRMGVLQLVMACLVLMVEAGMLARTPLPSTTRNGWTNSM